MPSNQDNEADNETYLSENSSNYELTNEHGFLSHNFLVYFPKNYWKYQEFLNILHTSLNTNKLILRFDKKNLFSIHL